MGLEQLMWAIIGAAVITVVYVGVAVYVTRSKRIAGFGENATEVVGESCMAVRQVDGDPSNKEVYHAL